jgi:hypothetical protein
MARPLNAIPLIFIAIETHLPRKNILVERPLPKTWLGSAAVRVDITASYCE